MKNKYLKRSKISEAKFRQIIKLFCQDLTATQIANLSNVSRQTVNRILMVVRQKIADHCQLLSPLEGQVEVDEGYFGPKRVKGKKGAWSWQEDNRFRHSKAWRQSLYTGYS